MAYQPADPMARLSFGDYVRPGEYILHSPSPSMPVESDLLHAGNGAGRAPSVMSLDPSESHSEDPFDISDPIQQHPTTVREGDLFNLVDGVYLPGDRTMSDRVKLAELPRSRQPRKEKGYICDCGMTFDRR